MYQRTEIRRPSGINKDLSPYELPPELWSDGENINFRRNRTTATKGYANPFSLTDTVVGPLHQRYFTDGVGLYWFYANESAIYRTDGIIAASAGTGYAATREQNWTSGNFNGLIYFNNQNNIPQVVDPTSGYTLMIDLPNWAAAAPWGVASRAESMRAFKNYMIALNCYDDTGVHYPHMVRWSSAAQAGDVPPSWDPAALGESAGLYSLSDTLGEVIDGKSLGDYFVVYKTDAVWLMEFIGGDFTFRFRKLFGDESGTIAKDCVAEFDGKHFVMSPNGAYIHNAASRTEIMEQWVKDEFFNTVAKDRILETKVVADHSNKEVWVYWVSKDSPDGWCDKAVTWNWETQKWAIKGLTSISYIAEGVINVDATGVETWDSDTNSWDSDQTIWNSDPALDPTTTGILLGDYTNQIFYKNEFSREGTGIEGFSWVKRIGIDFEDDTRFKYLTRVVPHVIGENPITVRVYAEDVQTGNPALMQTSVFDPSVDQDIDCHVTGRYLGIQFEGNDLWTLTGYSLEWEPTGSY